MATLAKQGVTMRGRWLAAVWCLTCSGAAVAAEFRVDGGVWDYKITGYQDDHRTITDFQTFAPGSQRDGFLQAAYEHGPSWWPDVAVAYAQVSGEGSQTSSALPLPNPLPLPLPIPDPTTTTVTASGDFRDIDFTARYGIALGPIKVSPGITVSWLKGNIATSDSSGGSSHHDYNKAVPLLHAQVAWPVADWLRLVAAGDWLRAGDNEAYQYGAAVELRVLGPLGLYGGWHARRYKLSSSESFIDANLRGWRYGLAIAF